MPRYVALLRGVSPMNARMPELKACFEQMGFGDVGTVLSSGNVVFNSARKAEPQLAKAIESGMGRYLPRSFAVIVRSRDHLAALLEADPYAAFHLTPKEKRVVTFLGQPCREPPPLPIELDGARILAVKSDEVFSAYAAGERGPVFMTLIEKTFGKNVTTRTWDTDRKCVAA
ncbi:MAG: DUF1697 domain-containing protein [Ottowia sp.]